MLARSSAIATVGRLRIAWSIAATIVVLVSATPAGAENVWTAPHDVVRDPSVVKTSSPSLAVAPNGDAVVAWMRDDPADNTTAGATVDVAIGNTRAAFGPVAHLSAPDEALAATRTRMSPQAAIGPDGTAVVTWLRYAAGSEVVEYAIRPAGSPSFGAPVTIGPGRAPFVFAGPEGSFVLFWQTRDYAQIKAIVKRPGTEFSTAIDLNPFDNSWSQDVDGESAVFDAAGKLTVSYSIGSDNVYVTTLAPGASSFAARTTVTALHDPDPVGTHVELAPNGDTLIGWLGYDQANNYRPYVSRWPGSTGAVDAPRAMGPTTSTGTAFVLPQGTVSLLDTYGYGGSPSWSLLYSTATDTVSSFSDPLAIDGPSSTVPTPSGAVGPGGELLALWRATDGVRFALLPAGSLTFGAPALVTGEQADWTPLVGMDRDGRAVAVWTEDSDDGAIRTAAYGPAPPPSVGGGGPQPAAPAGNAGAASPPPASTTPAGSSKPPSATKLTLAIRTETLRVRRGRPLVLAFTTNAGGKATLSYIQHGKRHVLARQRLKQGKNTIKVARVRLRPGRYKLTLAASTANGATVSKSIPLRVVG